MSSDDDYHHVRPIDHRAHGVKRRASDDDSDFDQSAMTAALKLMNANLGDLSDSTESSERSRAPVPAAPRRKRRAGSVRLTNAQLDRRDGGAAIRRALDADPGQLDGDPVPAGDDAPPAPDVYVSLIPLTHFPEDDAIVNSADPNWCFLCECEVDAMKQDINPAVTELISKVLANWAKVDSMSICRQVQKFYENRLRRTPGFPDKPAWAMNTIYEHFVEHAPTVEVLAEERLKASNRLLRLMETKHIAKLDENNTQCIDFTALKPYNTALANFKSALTFACQSRANQRS